MGKPAGNPAKNNTSQKKSPNGQTSSPLAYNVVSRSKAPKMVTTGGGTVVTHREVVAESVIAGPTYGINTTIAAQPGISSYSRGSPLGNWIPEIASKFDNYEFLSLKLHYVPTCATTKDGLVMMGFEPNPEDLAPLDFTSFKNAARSITGPVREPLTLDMSDRVRRKLLVRTANVSSLPLYDAGKIYVATLNGNSTSVGYLEVEYSIRLSNPQSDNGMVSTLQYDAIYPTYKVMLVSSTEATAYVGRTNASSNATALMSASFFAGTSGAQQGDVSLITWYNRPAVGANITSTIRSGAYYLKSGQFPCGFRFNRAGTYLVSWHLELDFLDYVPFKATLAKVGDGGALTTATYVVPTMAGGQQTIESDQSSVRGFSVPAVVPVDMPLDGSTLVSVTPAGLSDQYTLALGVWANSAVAEADTASVRCESTWGTPWFKVEYVSGNYSYS